MTYVFSSLNDVLFGSFATHLMDVYVFDDFKRLLSETFAQEFFSMKKINYFNFTILDHCWLSCRFVCLFFWFFFFCLEIKKKRNYEKCFHIWESLLTDEQVC